MAFRLPEIQKNGEYGSVKINNLQYSAHGDKACRDGYALKISSGAVTPRKKREVLLKYPSGRAMCRIGAHLAVAADEGLYLDGKKLCDLEKSDVKSFCTLGTKAYLIPDGVWCDCAGGEWGRIKEKWQGDVSFEARQGMHSIILDSDDPFNFAPGDRLRISGCTTYPHNNKVITVVDAEKDELRFPEGSFTLGVEYGKVTIERVIPNFTFMFACQDRLWGLCKDRIYVSSPDSPLLFSYENELEGTWNKTLAEGGDFTAGCDVCGVPYLFKDESVWRVTGNSPEEYGIQKLNLPGLAAKNASSLCRTSKGICYYGESGLVFATQNSYEIIALELPDALENVTCAQLGARLCVSGKSDGRSCTFLRESDGSWSPQNDVEAVGMTQYNGKAILLASDGTLYRESNEAKETPESVFESRDIFLGRRTALRRLELDLKLTAPTVDTTAVSAEFTAPITPEAADTAPIADTPTADTASALFASAALEKSRTDSGRKVAENFPDSENPTHEAATHDSTPVTASVAADTAPITPEAADTAATADIIPALSASTEETSPAAEIFISCDGGEYKRIAYFSGERQGETCVSLKGLKAARVKLKLRMRGDWCLRGFSLYYKKPN